MTGTADCYHDIIGNQVLSNNNQDLISDGITHVNGGCLQRFCRPRFEITPHPRNGWRLHNGARRHELPVYLSFNMILHVVDVERQMGAPLHCAGSATI